MYWILFLFIFAAIVNHYRQHTVIVYSQPYQKGSSWPLARGKEETAIEIDANGKAYFHISSLHSLAGTKLTIRSYNSNRKNPMQVSVTPTIGIIDDMDKYLQEDTNLRYDHVLGYNPGNMKNMRFTVSF
jgi:hypothetical protein